MDCESNHPVSLTPFSSFVPSYEKNMLNNNNNTKKRNCGIPTRLNSVIKKKTAINSTQK